MHHVEREGLVVRRTEIHVDPGERSPRRVIDDRGAQRSDVLRDTGFGGWRRFLSQVLVLSGRQLGSVELERECCSVRRDHPLIHQSPRTSSALE
jgi:hypothetical protein